MQVEMAPTSVPAAIGLCVEPALRQMTEHVLGVKLTRSGKWNTKGVLGATLDDIVANDRKQLVQYKSSSIKGLLDEGPPRNHLVQVHAEMVCAEADVAYLAYLLGGFGPLNFRIFRIERDDALASGVYDLAAKFMHEFVMPRKAPNAASMATLSRVIRVEGKRAPVDEIAFELYRNKRRLRLDAEKIVAGIKEKEEEALAMVVASMGDAEIGECPLGELHYPLRQRKGYIVAPTSYRTAVLKEFSRDSDSPAGIPVGPTGEAPALEVPGRSVQQHQGAGDQTSLG